MWHLREYHRGKRDSLIMCYVVSLVIKGPVCVLNWEKWKQSVDAAGVMWFVIRLKIPQPQTLTAH